MKQFYIKWIYFLAVVAGLQLIGCTESDEISEQSGPTSPQETRTNKSTPITVVLTEAGTLQAQLEAQLTDPTTVQDLTISGPFNNIDVEYLHQLKALAKLNMTDAKIKYNGSSYSIEVSTDYSVTGYLHEDVIGNYMFAYLPSLTEVTIPKTTLGVGSSIFEGSPVVTLNIPEGTTYIPAFNSCTTLTTINLPSTLKEIGDNAFQGCTSLEKLSIPDGVEKIGSWAFSRTNLSTIKLPGSLKEIRDYAFQYSTLTEVVIPPSVTTLGTSVFESCNQLKSLKVPQSVTQTDGSLINYCNSLQYLFWESEANIEDVQGVDESCCLYIQTNGGKRPGYGPNWLNVIIDGIAKKLTLRFNANALYAFSCPQTFIAEKISISIDFSSQWTYPGSASGWRTITLPFAPTSISHPEKGKLAPFGSDIAGAKPFWLRSLTTEGFKDETTILPNKPYLIAMPYNPELYANEYNISGAITFMAENAEIKATELTADEGPDYYLQPTYQFVGASDGAYVLNRSWWIDGVNYLGSIFSNNASYAAYCFEAYVKPKPGSTTRSIYSIDTRSVNTRSASQKNTTGIPAIGDM